MEAEIGATRQPGDFLKSMPCHAIIAFLEHEERHIEEPDLAGDLAQAVDILLHRIADIDGSTDLVPARLAANMGKDLADLRIAAAAIDTGHHAGECRGLLTHFGGRELLEARK